MKAFEPHLYMHVHVSQYFADYKSVKELKSEPSLKVHQSIQFHWASFFFWNQISRVFCTKYVYRLISSSQQKTSTLLMVLI